MRRIDTSDDAELGELEDTTEALPLHSKRTERLRKRQAVRQSKTARLKSVDCLLSLPAELILEILTFLKPSDLLKLRQVNKLLHAVITDSRNDSWLALRINARRYACLEQCFRTPALISDMDPAVPPLLQSHERQKVLGLHTKNYQHIQSASLSDVCTCITCLLRWSALNTIVDFAHWQQHLDNGEPIPMIPRGKSPEWNSKLLAANAETVRKALRSPLWHSRILEAHLDSTTRSIRRQAANKGNQRRRFRMTQEDVDLETDAFLERSGPPSLEVPYNRDQYYLLEAYLPNRMWRSETKEWMYIPADQHDRDIKWVVDRARREIMAPPGDNQSPANAREPHQSPPAIPA